MYTQEYLVKERQHERIRQAERLRAAAQVAELHKLDRQRQRAERQLRHAGRRAEQLRSLLSAG